MARDITQLHPLLQMLAAEFVRRCEASGYNVKITDCVRTAAEQADCIARGTSTVKYPYTMHAWGLAFDICQDKASNPYPSNTKWWQSVAAYGKALGLEWGGDWTSPVDRPHFQLDCYGDTNALVKTYGTPAKFFTHSDCTIVTPKRSITLKSSRKKVLWLQVRLNIHNAGQLTLDGVYGSQTIKAVQTFWATKTGKTCGGKIVKPKCISLLEQNPA